MSCGPPSAGRHSGNGEQIACAYNLAAAVEKPNRAGKWPGSTMLREQLIMHVTGPLSFCRAQGLSDACQLGCNDLAMRWKCPCKSLLHECRTDACRAADLRSHCRAASHSTFLALGIDHPAAASLQAKHQPCGQRGGASKHSQSCANFLYTCNNHFARKEIRKGSTAQALNGRLCPNANRDYE